MTADNNAHDLAFLTDHVGGGVKGAINVFFVRDVNNTTAYAGIGGGPIFYGEDAQAGFPFLEPHDFRHVIAHEMGHALCLDHVCPNEKEELEDSFFEHACGDSDRGFLMYPTWPSDEAFPQGQIDGARFGASGFEQGKTQLRSAFHGAVCGTNDNDTQ